MARLHYVLTYLDGNVLRECTRYCSLDGYNMTAVAQTVFVVDASINNKHISVCRFSTLYSLHNL